MSEREKLESCYRQMYDGMVRKDGRLLSEVLDDSFVLIHMTGMRQSKEVFIRSVEDGTLNYYFTAHQEIKAEILPRAGVAGVAAAQETVDRPDPRHEKPLPPAGEYERRLYRFL